MYNIVLHPTDLSEEHYDLCKKAVEITNYLKGTLHLLHVIEPPSSYQLAQGLGFAELAVPVKEDAQTVMRLLGESLNIPLNQQHVEVGSIKNHIFDTAKALGCNLIIIGSHRTHAFPFLGSTAYAVVQHATCDVLTVRAEDI